MSPTLNGSSALEHFERGNVIEIRNRFLPGTATLTFGLDTKKILTAYA